MPNFRKKATRTPGSRGVSHGATFATCTTSEVNSIVAHRRVLLDGSARSLRIPLDAIYPSLHTPLRGSPPLRPESDYYEE